MRTLSIFVAIAIALTMAVALAVACGPMPSPSPTPTTDPSVEPPVVPPVSPTVLPPQQQPVVHAPYTISLLPMSDESYIFEHGEFAYVLRGPVWSPKKFLPHDPLPGVVAW